MMTLYLVALLLGGTLLVFTLVLGAVADHDHDGEVDFDHSIVSDVDIDVDADVDADSDVDGGDFGAMDVVLAWLPITSIRFWTFFTAFFGGTGVALKGLDVISSHAIVGPIAAGVGWVAGFSVVRAIRSLRKNATTSSLDTTDFMGSTATVMVAVAKGSTGKIRLKLKGRFVESMAVTEDEEPLALKQQVLVYDVTDDGKVMVTKADQLEARS